MEHQKPPYMHHIKKADVSRVFVFTEGNALGSISIIFWHIKNKLGLRADETKIRGKEKEAYQWSRLCTHRIRG